MRSILDQKSIFKNTNGFSTVILLALIPVGLTLFLSITSIFFIQRMSSQLQFECQKQLLQTQRGAQNGIQLLFSLNPMAYMLETQRVSVIQKLAVAVSMQNYPLIAQLNAEFSLIIKKQISLNKKQNNIIKTTNAFIRSNGQISSLKIIQAQSQLQSIDNHFIKFQLRGLKYLTTNLAVQQKWRGLAPAYIEKDRFSEQQKIMNRYSYLIVIKIPFLESEQTLHKIYLNNECGATLYKEKNQWIPGVKEDRF